MGPCRLCTHTHTSLLGNKAMRIGGCITYEHTHGTVSSSYSDDRIWPTLVRIWTALGPSCLSFAPGARNSLQNCAVTVVHPYVRASSQLLSRRLHKDTPASPHNQPNGLPQRSPRTGAANAPDTKCSFRTSHRESHNIRLREGNQGDELLRGGALAQQGEDVGVSGR